jgi:rubrerythrin
MNFSSILAEIERLDPEVYERTSQRRDVIKNWGRKVALAAIPFALGSLFKKAYGKGTATINEVLNYALTLEYLEAEFYRRALTSGTLVIPTQLALQSITRIANHETQHVAFLQTAITASGNTPVSMPNFDFTGGNGSNSGPFSGVFNNYDTFLAVAQTLEDTGVRAYKGAAGDLMNDNDILTAALRIHSVEARHAAHIRKMRRENNATIAVKPWVTGNQSFITPAALVADNYDGEENTSQGNVNIATLLNGTVPISLDAATESFDEPLSMAKVAAIIDPFIV